MVCYIAVANGRFTDDYCSRFAATYHEYPAGIQHELMVIAQGGPLPQSTSLLFSDANAAMWPHPNDPGYDISAYIDAAKGPCATADIMVCLGETVYFHREGWLKRLVEAWAKHGPGMYGPFSSNNVRGHLQTTAFCCHPLMLKQYPVKVQNRADRMQFEHGENALWRRLNARGIPVRMVTWDGEWDHKAWRYPANIIYRGDQSNTLMWANHSDGFSIADARRRQSWARTADQPFR